MKIIKTDNYKKIEKCSQQIGGLHPGGQSESDKVKDLVAQGMNIYRAIRAVYPHLQPNQVEDMKNYFENMNTGPDIDSNIVR